MNNTELKFSFDIKDGLNSIKGAVENTLMKLNEYVHETEFFGLRLVITEILNNAVIHGQKSPSSPIKGSASLNLESGELEIEVEDNGDGFDWQELLADNRITPDLDQTLRENGRGYMLVRMYGYSYSFNKKGNKVKLVKTVKMNK